LAVTASTSEPGSVRESLPSPSVTPTPAKVGFTEQAASFGDTLVHPSLAVTAEPLSRTVTTAPLRLIVTAFDSPSAAVNPTLWRVSYTPYLQAAASTHVW
jgi:hypothetical protein